MAEKYLPHRPDDKKPPISRLKRKKKKVGDFNIFKSLSFRGKKESSKKSSDQSEMMKDQVTETYRSSDGKRQCYEILNIL